jgi:rhodanese-related sulfurtransferase
MGPLVPDIISNEFNLIVALLVGISFGFVLEQAGFSTTKKLVGLFYGYDFTVLRVFFTAGVTAMIGVLIMAHLGLLDLELIYVNPTFLKSAIIGGAIMGAGFIIGGFCPGTSICALATGKIDAFWFIIGSIIGILAFMEFYPQLKSLYLADNLGNLRIDAFFGISKELFAFILTAMALFAFIFTQKIQNHVHDVDPVYPQKRIIKYSIYAAIPFLIIALLTIIPDRQERIIQKVNDAKIQSDGKEITADKLAIELVNKYYKINLIDLRSPEKFKEDALPLAINIPIDSLLNREWKNYLTQTYKVNIFYADSEITVRKALIIAKYSGNAESYILKESTAQFKNLFVNLIEPSDSASKEDHQLYQFRSETARILAQLSDRLKAQTQPIKKVTKKVKGGCS